MTPPPRYLLALLPGRFTQRMPGGRAALQPPPVAAGTVGDVSATTTPARSAPSAVGSGAAAGGVRPRGATDRERMEAAKEAADPIDRGGRAIVRGSWCRAGAALRRARLN